MKIPININWNGFLNVICQPSRSKQESCAWIFADILNDVWNIWEVKNIGLKNRTIRNSFAPDKKELRKTKQLARRCKLTRIGNVHTHVVVGEDCGDYLDHQLAPSCPDVSYARRYNDIVRAVIVVHFKDKRSRGEIYGIIWFDQYGNILFEKKGFEIFGEQRPKRKKNINR